MTVSMVKRCHDTETHSVTFEEIWDATRNGSHGLKGKISQIRNRYEAEKDITGSTDRAKKAIGELKMELPGFMPSGSFSKRANEALVKHSGLLCADLDTLGERLSHVKEALRGYPCVRAVALSPSGDGLKVFFNVSDDPMRHEDSFRAVKQLLLDEAGLVIDEKCKDPARICFFTYDPDLWVRMEGNEIILPLDPIVRPKAVAPSASIRGTMTSREQIAFGLLGELSPAPDKGGYFVRCPGEGFHSNRSAEKHTILYLETVPTVHCQHESCAGAVDAFNRVLRSEIGKAEFVKPPNGQRLIPKISKNGDEPEAPEVPWIDILNKSAVTSTELHGLRLTPRKKLLGSWFCEGDLGFFFGPRGAGKTWFTLKFAKAVTSAGKFGDWEAPEAVKLLYVDGEMPPDSMQSRCEGLEAISDNLMILNHAILFDRTEKTMNITDAGVQDALTQFCLDHEIKVLVLDNLSTLGVGMKENDADSWEMVNTWLLGLRRRGVAVVIIHHSGRGGQMRGTSRREDNVFWIIAIDEIRTDSNDSSQGARFTSRFTKPSRNTPEDVPDYEWYFTPDKLTGMLTVTHKIAHSLTVFRSVIESGVTKPSEVAKVMRVEDYQVSRMAHKAIGQGWLERVNRGEYAIIEGK